MHAAGASLMCMPNGACTVKAQNMDRNVCERLVEARGWLAVNDSGKWCELFRRSLNL